jgi:methionine salvage enolase-phosphatase E1
MWFSLLKYAISFLLGELIKLAREKFEDYQEDQKKKEEIKSKVKAIKNAKTKEELRIAIRDLSI